MLPATLPTTAPPNRAPTAKPARAIPRPVRERPAQPSSIGASFTFAWRAMLKIKHVPMQLFDVTMFPVMFVLLFTYLFGGALAGSPSDYLQWLLPGILVMVAAQHAPRQRHRRQARQQTQSRYQHPKSAHASQSRHVARHSGLA